MSSDFGVNQALVEELYLRWRENPKAVAPEWRTFFEREAPSLTLPPAAPPASAPPPAAQGNGNGGRSNGGPPPGLLQTASGVFGLPATAELAESPKSMEAGLYSVTGEVKSRQARVSAMVNAFRVRGHLYADLDPLGLLPKPPYDLSVETFGLADVAPEALYSFGSGTNMREMPFRDIVSRLRDTYTRTIGAEFTFIEDPEERRWIQNRMEETGNHVDLSHDQQLRILRKLTDAETFELFLHKTYLGAKRFSVEGGEAVIPMIDLLIERAAPRGVKEVVIGMAHRGRLNVLINVLELPPMDILAAFEDHDPERYLGSGDVKYHLGHSTDRKFGDHDVHLTLSFNPSHLEFVNPVVEGRVRAKQDRYGDEKRREVLPLLIHGDAAFIGQGVVAETLNLSMLKGYNTGGTIHVVVNNQIGFTTPVEDARSTRYCTDITRMLRCPVFHVNGEDPEAVAQVAVLAAEYRQRFQRDVVIDLYCYRKWGHNEGDEPRFTQPTMYAAIDSKKTVREVYVEKMIARGKVTKDEADEVAANSRRRLEAALQVVRERNHTYEVSSFRGIWEGYTGGADIETIDVETGVERTKLEGLMDKVTSLPDDFSTIRQISAMLKHRRRAGQGEAPVDWGSAELLGFASLLDEGVNIRLTGQDAERGTFAHRHAVLYDAKNGRRHMPLGHLHAEQGRFEVYNSCLSEAGVLGFEYGYSLDSPDGLVIWEAQFGDFANSAQVLIDQFISSGEDKWDRLSGLVLLLPHGFEGQGPEHSSARLERFLALCAEDNLTVCNLTTAAQIFHGLRRQVKRPWRKPLIVMSPKSLLRSPDAASSLDELAGGSFQRVIGDPTVAPKTAQRVLLCSGKVYYDLVAERTRTERDDVAVVRLEQLYPLRSSDLAEVLSPYADDVELLWVQEEPHNMGAWYFIHSVLPELIGRANGLRCVSRPPSASPATGSKEAHKLEQTELVQRAFAGLKAKRKTRRKK